MIRGAPLRSAAMRRARPGRRRPCRPRSGGADTHSDVEARAVVSDADHMRQLDDLRVAEVLAQPGEEIVGDCYRSGGHADGVIEYELVTGSKTALAVVPQHVPNTSKGWSVAERRVAASSVVMAQPVWQGTATGLARAVAEPARPLAVHRLLQALDLAVGARGVGPGPPVLDPTPAQQLAQPAVVHVGEVVVGEQALGDDPVACEELERPLAEGGDRGRSLVSVDLGVGKTRAVVDDRVDELPARAPRVLGAVAGERVRSLSSRMRRFASEFSERPPRCRAC